MIKKVELLAPSGSYEKGKVALDYGADAIYLGAKAYSLRARASNFDDQELMKISQLVHRDGRKWYLVANVLCQNQMIKPFKPFLNSILQYQPDGIIVSDPYIIDMVQQIAPQLPIHISTQQSVTNSKACLFFARNHCQRVILSREVSHEELVKLIRNVDKQIEIEVFVHGAVCIGYSGRCMLSNNFCLRDANIGGCAQSCRWKLFLYNRDHKFDHVFTMSAKDMCLIEKIPELIAAGVSSFKIEGRMKSEYYLATIVSNYRKVIDQAFYHKPIDQKCYTDVLNAANRPVDTAWYDGIPNMHKMLYHEDERKVVQNYAFRIINKIDDQHYDIIVMNHMKQVFTYEVLDMKTNTVVPIIIKELFNDQNKIVDVLPTPMMHAKITLAHPVDLVVGDIGRIKN